MPYLYGEAVHILAGGFGCDIACINGYIINKRDYFADSLAVIGNGAGYSIHLQKFLVPAHIGDCSEGGLLLVDNRLQNIPDGAVWAAALKITPFDAHAVFMIVGKDCITGNLFYEIQRVAQDLRYDNMGEKGFDFLGADI